MGLGCGYQLWLMRSDMYVAWAASQNSRGYIISAQGPATYAVAMLMLPGLLCTRVLLGHVHCYGDMVTAYHMPGSAGAP